MRVTITNTSEDLNGYVFLGTNHGARPCYIDVPPKSEVSTELDEPQMKNLHECMESPKWPKCLEVLDKNDYHEARNAGTAHHRQDT